MSPYLGSSKGREDLEKCIRDIEKRRGELLKRFKTLSAIRAASVQELNSVLPKDAAMSVYQYFHQEETT